jgi:hypothetical protein
MVIKSFFPNSITSSTITLPTIVYVFHFAKSSVYKLRATYPVHAFCLRSCGSASSQTPQCSQNLKLHIKLFLMWSVVYSASPMSDTLTIYEDRPRAMFTQHALMARIQRHETLL